MWIAEERSDKERGSAERKATPVGCWSLRARPERAVQLARADGNSHVSLYLSARLRSPLGLSSRAQRGRTSYFRPSRQCVRRVQFTFCRYLVALRQLGQPEAREKQERRQGRTENV